MIIVNGLLNESEKPTVPQLNLEFFTKDLSYLSVGKTTDKLQYTDLQKQIRRILRDMKRIVSRNRSTADDLPDIAEISGGGDDIDEEISEEQTEVDYTTLQDDILPMVTSANDDEMSGTIQHITDGIENVQLNDSDDEEQGYPDDDQCILTPSMATPMMILSSNKVTEYLEALRQHGYQC